MDRHRQTRRLNDPQIALPIGAPVRERIPLDFTLNDVRRLKNESHAVMFSVRCSGYDPKEIPLIFGIDAGHWSCIKDGKKHFPHERRNEFMDCMGNEILLMYGAESRGYDFSTMRKHTSDVEADNERLRTRVAELERQREIEIAYAKALGR